MIKVHKNRVKRKLLVALNISYSWFVYRYRALNYFHFVTDPFVNIFLCIASGPVDLSKVSILNGIDVIVVNKGVYYPLKIETRDKYENLCELEYKEQIFDIQIKQVFLDR